ncbi:MAG: M20/M25/M40 family metallo-hydrolase [Mariniblastus sp.]|nr:M20/M25/M40 family metallo-hydrolase [Mariniblastus sp.]
MNFNFNVATVFIGLCLASLVFSQDHPQQSVTTTSRQPEMIRNDIEAYQDIASKIIKAGRKGNDSYLKLQELCDDIGNRLSGSESLEQAIRWAQESMKEDGQENVRAEKVTVRKWVRGKESCELIEPRPFKLDMLGLGWSVGTPQAGITAETIVVNDKAELDSLSDEQVKGKIVVFNKAMPQFSEIDGSGYGETVTYRSNGATWAAERGGVAALVRSVTAYSLASPHTGAMRYDANVKKIPAAAISVEAATMLRRLQDRGIKCVVKLQMEAEDQGDAESANVVAEIVGSEKPEEIVLIGGHIDSWDVGQGAQDDGAGCVAAMEAINILRKLNLQPKRTIRVVLWTNEENGLAGARSYAARHTQDDHVAGIESDSGGFKPEGLSIDMQDEDKQEIAFEQLKSVLKLLAPIGATRVKKGYSGADVGQLKTLGTACMGLNVDGRLYFNTHHTWADTVDKVRPKELTDCAITLAVAAYVIADMPNRLGEK